MKQLENPEDFDWVDPCKRRFSIYVYKPVYAHLKEAALVTGLPITQMVQVALMLAIADTDEWGLHLNPERENFIRRLELRLLILKSNV